MPPATKADAKKPTLVTVPETSRSTVELAWSSVKKDFTTQVYTYLVANVPEEQRNRTSGLLGGDLECSSSRGDDGEDDETVLMSVLLLILLQAMLRGMARLKAVRSIDVQGSEGGDDDDGHGYHKD